MKRQQFVEELYDQNNTEKIEYLRPYKLIVEKELYPYGWQSSSVVECLPKD